MNNYHTYPSSNRNQSGSQIQRSEGYNYQLASIMTPLLHSLQRVAAMLAQGEGDGEAARRGLEAAVREARVCAGMEQELQELRAEVKRLRNRNKKLEREISRCTQEKDSLMQQLQRTQDSHKSKIQKLARYANFDTHPHPPTHRPQCSSGVQCETICEATLLQLQQANSLLSSQLQSLHQRCSDLHTENTAKDQQITELLSTIDFHQRYNIDLLEDKENDNSTLDNDSEKSELHEEQQHFQEHQAQEQAKEAKGWIGTILSHSLKLRSFIFG